MAQDLTFTELHTESTHYQRRCVAVVTRCRQQQATQHPTTPVLYSKSTLVYKPDGVPPALTTSTINALLQNQGNLPTCPSYPHRHQQPAAFCFRRKFYSYITTARKATSATVQQRVALPLQHKAQLFALPHTCLLTTKLPSLPKRWSPRRSTSTARRLLDPTPQPRIVTRNIQYMRMYSCPCPPPLPSLT